MVSCFSQACKLFPFFIQRNFRDRMTIDDTRRILSERRSSVSSLARAYKLAFHVFYIDLPPYTLVTARDIHAVYIYCSAFELIKEACKLPPPPPFSSRNSYSRRCRLLPIRTSHISRFNKSRRIT